MMDYQKHQKLLRKLYKLMGKLWGIQPNEISMELSGNTLIICPIDIRKFPNYDMRLKLDNPMEEDESTTNSDEE